MKSTITFFVEGFFLSRSLIVILHHTLIAIQTLQTLHGFYQNIDEFHFCSLLIPILLFPDIGTGWRRVEVAKLPSAKKSQPSSLSLILQKYVYVFCFGFLFFSFFFLLHEIVALKLLKWPFQLIVEFDLVVYSKVRSFPLGQFKFWVGVAPSNL